MNKHRQQVQQLAGNQQDFTLDPVLADLNSTQSLDLAELKGESKHGAERAAERRKRQEKRAARRKAAGLKEVDYRCAATVSA